MAGDKRGRGFTDQLNDCQLLQDFTTRRQNVKARALTNSKQQVLTATTILLIHFSLAKSFGLVRPSPWTSVNMALGSVKVYLLTY
jgi:hypothetical protein